MSTSLVVSKHIAVTYHWHGRLLGSVNNTLAHSTHTLVLMAHLHNCTLYRSFDTCKNHPLTRLTSCELVLLHTLPRVHLSMLALGTQRLLHTRTQSGALHTFIPGPTLPRSHLSTLYVQMHTRCTHVGIFVILHTWHTGLTHTDASAPRPIISFASRVRFVSREATIACKHHRKLNMVDV